MQRQRVSADYLQTSAVIDAEGLVHSAVSDPNLYDGPGTGYRLEGARWETLQALPHVVDAARLGTGGREAAEIVVAGSAAHPGTDPAEVVVAVGPAFADGIRETINGLDHGDVLAAVLDGIEEAGATPRLVRVRRVADVAFIAHDGACLSGSGIALGIQSKGTAVIHRADLQPLDNLELFGMSPLYSLESYRAMGRNAAGYALGKRVGPVPTELDNFARAKLIVRTTLLHARETRAVVPRRGARRADARTASRRAVGPAPCGAAAHSKPRVGAPKPCDRLLVSRGGGAAAHSKPCARCCACSNRSRSSSSRKRRTSSQTTAAKSTSACSVLMRMPPRFWSFAAEIPQSRSGRSS